MRALHRNEGGEVSQTLGDKALKVGFPLSQDTKPGTTTKTVYQVLYSGLLSFFLMHTTGAANGDLDLTIHPLNNSSYMHSFTSLNSGLGLTSKFSAQGSRP